MNVRDVQDVYLIVSVRLLPLINVRKLMSGDAQNVRFSVIIINLEILPLSKYYSYKEYNQGDHYES